VDRKQSRNLDVRFFKTGEDESNVHLIEYDNDGKQNGNENDDIHVKQDQNDDELSENDDATIGAFEHNFNNTSINEDENIQDKTVMFQGSQTTVLEVILMIHTYCVRFNVSDEGRYALFDMVKTYWADPELKNINFSKYMISKRLDPPENIYQYVFYCTKCNCLLGKFIQTDLLSNIQRICEKCQTSYKISTNATNYFLSIDVKFQLMTLLENATARKMLLENITVIKNRLKKKNITRFKILFRPDWQSFY